MAQHGVLWVDFFVFTEVSNIIDERNGVVDKFIGDAVMALFGAPITGDQDPQNAVQAALDMCEMLRKLNVDLQERGYLQLDIGIHLQIVLNLKNLKILNNLPDFIYL